MAAVRSCLLPFIFTCVVAVFLPCKSGKADQEKRQRMEPLISEIRIYIEHDTQVSCYQWYDETGSENNCSGAFCRDGNLITAAATGALEMTRLTLEYLDVFGASTLEHWYAYFSTGNANEFYAMMQSLQK